MLNLLDSVRGQCADLDPALHHIRGAFLMLRLHDEARAGLAVDRVDEEPLLVDWIGVTRMRVLIARRFDETYRRQVTGVGRGPEIRHVVLVVGLVGPADHAG